MTTIAPPICIGCTHLDRTEKRPLLDPKCTAFPAGIPNQILRSRADHRQPFPADQGITFEPATPRDGDYAAFILDGVPLPGPAVRATTEAGGFYADPSPDLLRNLVAELRPGNSFVIVETGPINAECYVQARRRADDEWVVEHRDGDRDHHYKAITREMPLAQAVVVGWTFGSPGWRDQLAWHQLRL